MAQAIGSISPITCRGESCLDIRHGISAVKNNLADLEACAHESLEKINRLSNINTESATREAQEIAANIIASADTNIAREARTNQSELIQQIDGWLETTLPDNIRNSLEFVKKMIHIYNQQKQK